VEQIQHRNSDWPKHVASNSRTMTYKTVGPKEDGRPRGTWVNSSGEFQYDRNCPEI
jgi:hypothetical protein